MKLRWLILLFVAVSLVGCIDELEDLADFDLEFFEDHDGIQLLHPPFANYDDQYIYEVMDNELLNSIMYNYPENYTFSLIEAKEYADAIGKAVEIIMVLHPGFGTTEDLFIQFNEAIAPRFMRTGIPFPQDGIYSIVNLQVITSDPNQNLIDLQSTEADKVKKAADKGGICATLAIAHSLIRRLNGLIPKDATGAWPSVTKTADGKEVWKAEFLKKIYESSGDTDGNRGITPAQAEKAHTADRSSNWKIHTSKPFEDIKRDGTDLTDQQLADRCKKMKDMIENKKDDCLLTLYGTQTVDGKEVKVGHMMTITGVDCSNGSMKVTTINTGKQDPNQDFENVPYNPGEETWDIGKTGITPPPGWNSITWKDAHCMCFDEDLKDKTNPDQSRGVPVD